MSVKIFILELNESEVNLVLSGLGQLQAFKSYDLITKIRLKAESQLDQLDQSDKSLIDG